MLKIKVGEDIVDGGLVFQKFCYKEGVEVLIAPDSKILFGENDHDLVMSLWSKYCEKSAAEVFAHLDITV